METEFRMFWREEDGMWSSQYKVIDLGARPYVGALASIRQNIRALMIEQFGEIEEPLFEQRDIVAVGAQKEVRFTCRDDAGTQLYITVKIMKFHKPLPPLPVANNIYKELEELLKPVADVIVIPLTLEEFNNITGADKSKEELFPKEFGDVPVPTKFNFVVSAFEEDGTLKEKPVIDGQINSRYVGNESLGAKYRILAELGNAYKSTMFMAEVLGMSGRYDELATIGNKAVAIDELAREYSKELFGKEM